MNHTDDSVITFIFLLGTLRSSVALFLVFFFLEITFWVLAAGHFTEHVTVTKAGGGLGVVTAFLAFYTALAGIREYSCLPSCNSLPRPPFILLSCNRVSHPFPLRDRFA